MKTKRIPSGALLALVALAGSVGAQTITVTTAFDEVDVPTTATIADLPGPNGVVSLREALRVSDNEPGHQTIGFAIPDDQRWLPNIYPEFVLLQASGAFGANDPVTIDGTTQTAFGGDINPDGHEIVVELGVGLNADDSELFGFHGTHVGLGGNNSVIHDNTGAMRISVGPFNSGCVVRDNSADTIEITYSDDNVVIRNVAERVRITGQGTFGPPASGNRIGGPDPADRNFITGWGNVGEHGSVAGTTVELYYTAGTLIENNWIGTTPDGMAIGNHASTVGVGIYNDNHDVTVRNNLIAIQSHWGGGTSGPPGGAPIYLDMYLGGTGIRILGNTLGLDALGAPVLGGAMGIKVRRYAYEYPTSVQIGGPNPGEGNVIAGHGFAGVLMEIGPGITPIGNIRLSRNLIYANGGDPPGTDVSDLDIDLMPNTWDFGPTPNDPLDADVGANGLQNFPVVTSATLQGPNLRLVGSLHSEPMNAYTIEFFAAQACSSTGFGPAEAFLGSTVAVTDAAGDSAFDVTVPAQVPAGWVVTATATLEPIGRTSEFSACTAITGAPEPGTSTCFGDGSGTPCPCGNDSATAGEGCLHSGGAGMTIGGSGSTSIAADDLVLSVAQCPPGNTGIFYVGQTSLAPGTALYDGLQCAGGDVRRFQGRFQTDGTVSDTAFVGQDPSGVYFVPGATCYFQYWSRDFAAGSSPCGTLANFSPAYTLTMTP